MESSKSSFYRSLAWSIVFWLGILAYLISTANMHFFGGYRQVVEFNLMVLFTQIITASVSIKILIPKFLDRKRYIEFFLTLLLLMFSLFVVYNLFKLYYYDPKYQHTFSELGKQYANDTFLERINSPAVFLSKALKFLTPTALLLMVQFYKNQRQLSELKEQKRTAELSALKNQLNPHFLFNTLNNLYSLAIEKSEKTPEVIERLSNILDHILYRCNDNYISLDKEILLIENYLALEKVRYGNRAEVTFTKDIKRQQNIAPLILMTFIENAFKHGVKQELEQAKIDIFLASSDGEIRFQITNTKPIAEETKISAPLGLKNVQKQLDLLYLNNYDLVISNDEKSYGVSLKIKVNTHV